MKVKWKLERVWSLHVKYSGKLKLYKINFVTLLALLQVKCCGLCPPEENFGVFRRSKARFPLVFSEF